MGLLDRLPAIVGRATANIVPNASLTKKTGALIPDGRGGATRANSSALSCKALMSDYSDVLKGLSNGGIAIKDRKALLIAASLPAGTVPEQGDTLTAEGSPWEVLGVKRDPAAATYELHVRPA